MLVRLCVYALVRFVLKYQGNRKLLKMFYISSSAMFIKKVTNFEKTWLKRIEYAESEFGTFEFVTCKFIVVIWI